MITLFNKVRYGNHFGFGIKRRTMQIKTDDLTDPSQPLSLKR